MRAPLRPLQVPAGPVSEKPFNLRCSTHHPPLIAKRLHDPLHAIDQRVIVLADPLPPLPARSLGPIEHEQRQPRRVHERRASKEQCSQFGILALLPVLGVEEPDGGVDAYAEAAELVGVGFEAVDYGEVVV